MALPALPGIERLGPEGAAALEAAAVSLGAPPRELAAAVFIESGFRTRAVNPTTGATGLIQWLPATAAALGTTTAQIAEMSAVEQAALIARTLAPYRGKLGTFGDVYIVVVVPAFLGKPDSAVWAAGGTARFERNKGLDADKDGDLTVGDLRARVARALGDAPPAVPTRVPRGGGLGLGPALAALGLLFVAVRR